MGVYVNSGGGESHGVNVKEASGKCPAVNVLRRWGKSSLDPMKLSSVLFSSFPPCKSLYQYRDIDSLAKAYTSCCIVPWHDI